MEIVIRHDDFDFRLHPAQYIAVHEEFLKRGLTETAVLQFGQFGHLANFHPDLIQYMKTTPGWDMQLHGWNHEEYDKFTYDELIRDLAASKWMTFKLFEKVPTVWYTPWNRRNVVMEKAAMDMDMTISNESYDIAKFIREMKAGIYTGTSFYFHAWQQSELVQLPEALDLCAQLKKS